MTASSHDNNHSDSGCNGSDLKWKEPRAAEDNSAGVLSEIISFLPFQQCTKGTSTQETMWTIAQGVFPCLKWLPKYDTKLIHKDIIAGLTVGVMLVPQGMAYAMIAGLNCSEEE